MDLAVESAWAGRHSDTALVWIDQGDVTAAFPLTVASARDVIAAVNGSYDLTLPDSSVLLCHLSADCIINCHRLVYEHACLHTHTHSQSAMTFLAHDH